jgi:CheY-like chemotaxis protein
MNEQMILIVEDNPANQLLVSAVLEREGYVIVLAGSALEARAVIDRRLPNLILMDVQLPGIDGLTFTRQLKSDPVTADIPVVALTALAMSGDRERTLEAGCVGYISKPINTRTFADEVRGYLRPKPEVLTSSS